MEPLASCKEFKQRRRLRSNGEIEEEGQEEGSQAKGNQEGGSGCFSTCNHIRRSSGEYNDILGLRAGRSTSHFCYVGDSALPASGRVRQEAFLQVAGPQLSGFFLRRLQLRGAQAAGDADFPWLYVFRFDLKS